MKKFFTIAAIAVCAMAFAVACNNADNTEKQDTPVVDTPEMIDTPAIDTMAQDSVAPAEEPAPAKTTAKKGTKTAKDTKKTPNMTAATSNERCLPRGRRGLLRAGAAGGRFPRRAAFHCTGYYSG